MRVAIIDPFFDISHQFWANGLIAHSCYEYDLFTRSAHNWKWRMVSTAIEIAQEIISSKKDYDLFLVTDMLNVPLFKSLLTSRYCDVPIALYFHENQISYPWSPHDQDKRLKRDHHYGFINLTSAIVADQLIFNSQYHLDSFFGETPHFLSRFPDKLPVQVESLKAKSKVLPIGFSLDSYRSNTTDHHKTNQLTILWNHRWEADKNPMDFYKTLVSLREEEIPFQLILCGKQYKISPAAFTQIISEFKSQIIHKGFVTNRSEYLDLLQQANLLLVTNHQEFFGISTVEAIASNCYPILPRRLSYPEHIPENEHSKHFYQTIDQIAPLIKRHWQEIMTWHQGVHYVSQYDWSVVTPLYESLIENMVNIAP